MEVWPASLPTWQYGYTIDRAKQGLLRSNAPLSSQQQRATKKAKNLFISARLVLSPEQFATFENFVINSLKRVAYFDGPYQDGGGNHTGAIRLVSGNYTANQMQNANLYSVAAVIEVQRREFDEELIAGFYFIDNTTAEYAQSAADAWDEWYT